MSNMNTGDYQTKATLETFGFLPRFSAQEIQAQVAYIIAQGWTPAIEHDHPSNASSSYWTMWKLPFFGEQQMDAVLSELEACRRSYPDHHVRLIGYDSYTQCQGACFVAYEAQTR